MRKLLHHSSDLSLYQYLLQEISLFPFLLPHHLLHLKISQDRQQYEGRGGLIDLVQGVVSARYCKGRNALLTLSRDLQGPKGVSEEVKEAMSEWRADRRPANVTSNILAAV